MKRLLIIALGLTCTTDVLAKTNYVNALPKHFYGCYEDKKGDFDVRLSEEGWQHYQSRELSSGGFTVIKMTGNNKAFAVDELGYEYSLELKNPKTLVWKLNSKVFDIQESYIAQKVKCPTF